MKFFSKLLVMVLIVSLVSPAYSQEAEDEQEVQEAQEAQEAQPAAQEQQSGVNLKVGDNFYFEGNVNDNANDDKEESMAETQSTPIYKQTWFIATVAIVVIAGAAVGVYYGTRTSEPNGKTVEWDNAK